MKNIWIDTDPGLDDALAIIWALKNEKAINWKIHGISSVQGNLGIAQVNGNLKALVKHLGREDIPLYNGASHALVQKYSGASYFHGSALGPIDVEAIEFLSEKKAVLALAECVSQLDGKLLLITLGPLTNIAIFIRLYPELLSKIECIVMMGGGSYGNISHYAEFNIHEDPEAAHIVFESGISIVMSGLDISDKKTYIYPREFEHYLSLSSNLWTSKMINYMSDKSTSKILGDIVVPLYDPTAMIAAAFPELFEMNNSSVFVECHGNIRGMTKISEKSQLGVPLSKDQNIRILQSCDRENFLHILFKGL